MQKRFLNISYFQQIINERNAFEYSDCFAFKPEKHINTVVIDQQSNVFDKKSIYIILGVNKKKKTKNRYGSVYSDTVLKTVCLNL